VTQKVPRQGKKEKIRTYILQRHPQGRSPDNDPGPDRPADQPIEEAKNKEIYTEDDEKNEFGDARCDDAVCPEKGSNAEKGSKQEPETGCEKCASLTQREQ